MNILLVEDDAALARELSLYLYNAGYVVAAAPHRCHFGAAAERAGAVAARTRTARNVHRRFALTAEPLTTAGAPTGELAFQIRNTGAAIAPEQLPRLFERFHRADATGLVEGHGLGLTLARAIARLHGLRLTLESAPNVGTTATLRWQPPITEKSPFV
jgi:signal transduction histidine kinase